MKEWKKVLKTKKKFIRKGIKKKRKIRNTGERKRKRKKVIMEISFV